VQQGHALGHHVRADAKHAGSGHKLGWTIAPGQLVKGDGQLPADVSPLVVPAVDATSALAPTTVVATETGEDAASPEIAPAAYALVEAPAPQPAPLAPVPGLLHPAASASAIDAATEAASTAPQAPAPTLTPDAGESGAEPQAPTSDMPSSPVAVLPEQPAQADAGAGQAAPARPESAAAAERPALTRSTAFAENRPAEAARVAVAKGLEAAPEAPEAPAAPQAQAEATNAPPAHAQVPAWAAAAERAAGAQTAQKTETSKPASKAESKIKADGAAVSSPSADATAAPAAAKTSMAPSAAAPHAAVAAQTTLEGAESPHADVPQVEVAAGEAAAQADAPEAPPPANTVRGAPETVAHLASQIVKKLEGRQTRFEIQLDPVGLGSVQVKMEINAQGELSAHMNFERADTAADLKSRAQELQRALEQAGFDLSRGSLSFEHGQRERGQNHADGRPAHSQGRAFADALRTAEAADLPPGGPIRLQARARMGVDVRI
jgi:hypothetical protein